MTTLPDAREPLPVGAYVASALMAASIECDSGEDVDRFLAKLADHGYAVKPYDEYAESTDAAMAEAGRSALREYRNHYDAARETEARAAVLERALKAARDRYDDLRFCNKLDLCRTKAEGARLAIEDIEYEFAPPLEAPEAPE